MALVVSGWGMDFSGFPLLPANCLPPNLAVTTFSNLLHPPVTPAVWVQNYEGQDQIFLDMRQEYAGAKLDSCRGQGLLLLTLTLISRQSYLLSILIFNQMFS